MNVKLGKLSRKQIFGTVLFSIFAIVLFTVSLLFFSVKQMVSKEGIKYAFRNVNIRDTEMGKSLVSDIYKVIPQASKDVYGITKEDINNVLSEDDFQNYLGEVVADSFELALGDEDVEISPFDADKIYGIFKENPNLVEDLVGIEPTDEVYDQIYSDLQGMETEVIHIRSLNIKEDNSDDKTASEIMKEVFNPVWGYVFLALGTLNLLFIYLVSKRNISYTFALYGIISILFSILAYKINEIVSTGIEGGVEHALENGLFEFLMNKISQGMMIGLYAGIAEIVLAAIIKIARQKKAY